MAVAGALLGDTNFPGMVPDGQGGWLESTITIPSSLGQRITHLANQGEFDKLITDAISQITADEIKPLIAETLVAKLMSSINHDGRWHSGDWFRNQFRSIAQDAATAAMASDADLMDRLRALIGGQVDRDEINVTVSLSGREAIR
ncbi:MAG: hypothetical protein AAGE88_18305 [Actinomycetota bacterium]